MKREEEGQCNGWLRLKKLSQPKPTDLFRFLFSLQTKGGPVRIPSLKPPIVVVAAMCGSAPFESEKEKVKEEKEEENKKPRTDSFTFAGHHTCRSTHSFIRACIRVYA